MMICDPEDHNQNDGYNPMKVAVRMMDDGSTGANFTGENSLVKWNLISNFKSPCFTLVKRSSASTGSLLLVGNVLESSQRANSKTSLTKSAEAVAVEKLVIACRPFHKIPRDLAKIKNMAIPTRRMKSIGSFWRLLIHRWKELVKYKYSKCHLIRCLLYVLIASKIKTLDCRMLWSPTKDACLLPPCLQK